MFLHIFQKDISSIKGIFHPKMKTQSLSAHSHTDGRFFLFHKTLLEFQGKKPLL